DTFTCDTTSDQVLEFGLTFGIFIERFREDVAPVLHNGVYERDVVLEVIRVGKISNGDDFPEIVTAELARTEVCSYDRCQTLGVDRGRTVFHHYDQINAAVVDRIQLRTSPEPGHWNSTR